MFRNIILIRQLFCGLKKVEKHWHTAKEKQLFSDVGKSGRLCNKKVENQQKRQAMYAIRRLIQVVLIANYVSTSRYFNISIMSQQVGIFKETL